MADAGEDEWCPKPVRHRGALVECNLRVGHAGRCEPGTWEQKPYEGKPDHG